MDDGFDLLGRQGYARFERDQDRRRGLVRAGSEKGLLGDHDVYHRGAHTVYGLDGLLELVGDGLLVLDLLLELRSRHPRAVEQAVALVSRGGEAGGRHVQALLVDVAARDQHLLAALGQLVGDFIGRKFLGYRRRVGGAQVGEQGHIRRLGRPRHKEVPADHHGQDGHYDNGFLAARKTGDDLFGPVAQAQHEAVGRVGLVAGR